MSDKPTKYYFRQRQQNRLFDTVIHALEKAGMRRKDIAHMMEVPPSQITRLLTGPANWTIDTVSDLLFSVGAELDFRVTHYSDRAKGNMFHPAGQPLLSSPSSAASFSYDIGSSAPPSSSSSGSWTIGNTKLLASAQ